MTGAVVADTGGLLRALALNAQGKPAWPEYQEALTTASRVIVPSTILPEVDYFLREEREAMRRLVADIFDPASRYDYDVVSPTDLVRALHIDAKFADLALGLVDCSVAAVAERRRAFRVLTTDHRHFHALRIGPRYDRRLAVVP